jgi:hypothetical protein
LHIKVEVSFKAGMLPMSTVGAPATQGAGVTGTQGAGVKTPAAVPHDDQGRLHDLVWMARLGVPMGCNEPEWPFVMEIENEPGKMRAITLKILAHSGDNGEPVLTIKFPYEN